MSDLVGNPNRWFSHAQAHIVLSIKLISVSKMFRLFDRVGIYARLRVSLVLVRVRQYHRFSCHCVVVVVEEEECYKAPQRCVL